jgi:hypothetical protein
VRGDLVGIGEVIGDVYGFGDGYGYGNGNGYGDGNGDGDLEIDPSTPIVAYHYVPFDGRLRYLHGVERPLVEPGLVLEWHGDLVLCDRGLHASFTAEEAASYCKGVLTKVACSGQVKMGTDKFVCSRREVLEVLSRG